MAEGGREEQQLIAVVCPASGFESSPPGAVAAIQAVPLHGQKYWGGMGQKKAEVRSGL